MNSIDDINDVEAIIIIASLVKQGDDEDKRAFDIIKNKLSEISKDPPGCLGCIGPCHIRYSHSQDKYMPQLIKCGIGSCANYSLDCLNKICHGVELSEWKSKYKSDKNKEKANETNKFCGN